MNPKFRFELKQAVIITGSEENGIIIGQGCYTNCNNQYLIRYLAGDGRMTEKWWDEDAIVEI